jgi:hypothetical protein
LRQEFTAKYSVRKINFFEEQTFKSVRVTLCSFEFYLGREATATNICILPSREYFSIKIHEGYLVNLETQFSNSSSIEIANGLTKKSKFLNATSLVLRTFDSSSKRKSGLFFSEDAQNSNGIRISTNFLFSEDEQRFIASEFNSIIKTLQQKYSSLIFPYFLSCQYLGFKRKKIPTKDAFYIINHIIKKMKKFDV